MLVSEFLPSFTLDIANSGDGYLSSDMGIAFLIFTIDCTSVFLYEHWLCGMVYAVPIRECKALRSGENISSIGSF